MYFHYMKEKDSNFHVLEQEYGFATYRYMDFGQEKAVYIEDIYVVPDRRKENLASKMSAEIVEVGRAKGCTYMLGTVDLSLPSATESIKVLLAHGMRLVNYFENNTLWFTKEI